MSENVDWISIWIIMGPWALVGVATSWNVSKTLKIAIFRHCWSVKSTQNNSEMHWIVQRHVWKCVLDEYISNYRSLSHYWGRHVVKRVKNLENSIFWLSRTLKLTRNTPEMVWIVLRHVRDHVTYVSGGNDGCIRPPRGRQMPKSGKKPQIWAVFHLFWPITQANVVGFQIFLHFWNRGSFLSKI